MQIFNIEIWGVHADDFMALSCAKKKEWIKENTNQKQDVLIEEFIKYACRGNDDECHGCKEAKSKPSVAELKAAKKADEKKQPEPDENA